MATIDKDALVEQIDRLLKEHNYAIEDWFANTIHNTVWDAPEIETDGETIYRADAIDAVKDTMKRLVDDEPKGDSDTFTEYCGKLAKLTSINVEILKSLSALPSAKAVSREVYEKRTQADERIIDSYRREFAKVASAGAVQGEWIFRTDIPIGGGRESAGYVCSNCRKDYFHVDGMSFCPNCGAKMKGGDAE